MRFLIVITDLNGGGAERAILKLAAGLTQHGHHCEIILLRELVRYEVPPAVQIHALAAGGADLPSSWIDKVFAARRLRKLHARIAKGQPFDLIVSTLAHADELVWHAGLPNAWFRIANNTSRQIAALAHTSPREAQKRLRTCRKIYGGSKLVAVSDGIAEDLRSSNLALNPVELATISNPFDIDSIRLASKSTEQDLPKEPYVMHVGRFVPQKRHDVLLDAYKAADIPHKLVLLVQPHDALVEMIKTRGLSERVTIAGFRSNPYPWYANAETLIHSSDFEGCANVLIESLICNTPVVSTDCPFGPSEILTGDLAQWLVPCGDAEALASKLRESLKAPPRIDPDIMKRFSVQRAVHALERLARRE